MSDQKPKAKPKSSLIAAAKAQSRSSSSSTAPPADQPASSSTTVPATLASVTASAANNAGPGPSSFPLASDPTRSRTVSADRTTPGGTPGPEASGSGLVPVVQKMKFKPKMPMRKPGFTPAPPTSAASTSQDVKPDVRALGARGGAPRGRGRGGPAMRGRDRMATQATVVAAGPLSAARSNQSFRRAAPPPPPSRRVMEDVEIEDYSDQSDPEAQAVIDIDAVSRLGESAPTSLYRQRDLATIKGGKPSKEKVSTLSQRRKIRRNRRRRLGGTRSEDAGSSSQLADRRDDGVKAEPISPDKLATHIPLPQDEDMMDEEVKHVPRLGRRRGDDTMAPEDEMQDRDDCGRRVRAFARTGGLDEGISGLGRVDIEDDEEDVDDSQKVDLSESDDEEEEESMEGDFVYVDGYHDPSDKLFTFQFPSAFPKFIPNDPITINADLKEGITDAKGNVSGLSGPGSADIKPSLSQLRGRRKAQPPPEGRVGTLVIMKSGRVKMVLGDNIVMDVTPGVSPSFLQQIVHVDPKEKTNAVLGEVYKNYVVTPDIDRLLEELFVSGGVTPAEKERERIRQERAARGEAVKVERH